MYGVTAVLDLRTKNVLTVTQVTLNSRLLQFVNCPALLDTFLIHRIPHVKCVTNTASIALLFHRPPVPIVNQITFYNHHQMILHVMLIVARGTGKIPSKGSA